MCNSIYKKATAIAPFALALCAGLFLLTSFSNRAHADCTLAATAVCDGQPCPGKTFKAGQAIYNGDHGALQVCLADNTWKAIHKPAAAALDSCTTTSTIGTTCADGQTVYAGTWNGDRYYTTKNDQTSGMTAYYGTYQVDLGANSRDAVNGLLNTNTALASLEANPQTGACNAAPYNPPICAPNAAMLCKGLRTTLGGNWYLPARDELINVLYNNRVAIGGFSTTSSDEYWASTNFSGGWYAYGINFSDAGTSDSDKNRTLRVRCVRK